uniref:Uncharacterized protein n=1 Tax=Anopheles melas TaxID=34690 RepID=A0A182TMF7_9DIPT
MGRDTSAFLHHEQGMPEFPLALPLTHNIPHPALPTEFWPPNFGLHPSLLPGAHGLLHPNRGKLGILQPECHVTLDRVAAVAGNGGEQVFTERFLSELYRPGGGREIKLALYLDHRQIVLGAVIVLLVEVYRFDAIVPTVGEELFRAVEHVQLLQWKSDLYDKKGENQ